MANYNLVSKSQFNPFSFDELLKPALMATQAHRELEDQLTELDTKANVWEGMADEVNDEKTYKQYKRYADDLRKQADTLAREGLNVGSRRALSNMKARYSSEIIPIEQAYNAREADKKRQAEAYDRDDSIMFDRVAATTSLDDYLGGNISPYRQASGRKITADVAAQAGNLAKVLRGYGPGARIDDYTKSFLKRYGFTPEEVQRAINNPKDAKSSKVLDAIVESTMSASDMAGWKNKALLNRGYDYAREGLWAAIGQNQVSPMEDFIARYKAQHPDSDTPPVSPMSELSHWGYINSGAPELEGFKELKEKLISGYGKGLSTDYVGKTFVNPMKIYEEAREYARKHPSTKYADTGVTDPIYGTPMFGYVDNSNEDAAKAIMKKYNIKGILTPSEYEAMKRLGYTSASKFEEMAGTNLSDRINEQASVYSPTSTNLSKYDWVDEKVRKTMGTWDSDDVTNMAYEYSNGKKKGALKYDDIFDEEGKNKVSDVAYSINNPEFVIMTIGKKNILVDPTAISQEFADVVDYAKSRASYATDNKLKSQLQDITTFKLRQLLNNYGQVRTESSSKI